MFPHDCTAIIIATEWKQFWKMLWNFKVPIIIMCSQQFRKKTGPSAWHQLPSAPAPSLSALNTHRHTPINRKQILLCLQEGQGLWFLDLWDAIWGLKGHVKRTASWSTNKNSQRYLKSLARADNIFEEGQHFSSLFEVCLFAALQGVPHILEERRSVTWALAQSCSEPWLPPLSRITRYKKSPWPPFPVHKILFLLAAFSRGEQREQETRICHGSSSLEEITAWVKLSHHSQNDSSACNDRANIMLPHLPNTRKINLSNPKLNRNKMQALCTQWIIYILKKIILWGLLLHSACILDNRKNLSTLIYILSSYSLQPCWFPRMFDIGYNKVLSGQISAKGLFFLQAYVYPHK